MAKLSVIIEIDDPTVEADFYATLRKQNDNDFLQFVGGTVETLQAATPEDTKAFVNGLIAARLVNDYQSLKIQQATQDFQKLQFEEVKTTIEAKTAEKPFVLARKESSKKK